MSIVPTTEQKIKALEAKVRWYEDFAKQQLEGNTQAQARIKELEAIIKDGQAANEELRKETRNCASNKSIYLEAKLSQAQARIAELEAELKALKGTENQSTTEQREEQEIETKVMQWLKDNHTYCYKNRSELVCYGDAKELIDLIREAPSQETSETPDQNAFDEDGIKYCLSGLDDYYTDHRSDCKYLIGEADSCTCGYSSWQSTLKRFLTVALHLNLTAVPEREKLGSEPNISQYEDESLTKYQNSPKE